MPSRQRDEGRVWEEQLREAGADVRVRFLRAIEEACD
jgi:hypothetical protein